LIVAFEDFHVHSSRDLTKKLKFHQTLDSNPKLYRIFCNSLCRLVFLRYSVSSGFSSKHKVFSFLVNLHRNTYFTISTTNYVILRSFLDFSVSFSNISKSEKKNSSSLFVELFKKLVYIPINVLRALGSCLKIVNNGLLDIFAKISKNLRCVLIGFGSISRCSADT